MTHHHYDPSELDRRDPDLDAVAERLEGYASTTPGEPPIDLVGRIVAAVDDEPVPRGAWWAALATWRRPAQALAAAAVVVAAITGAMAVGELFDQARQRNVGASPSPSIDASPTAAPSTTPSPSPVPSPSESASPPATPSPTAPAASRAPDDPRTPVPTASADDDDQIETPEPSESEHDNSGPGGGGGDDD